MTTSEDRPPITPRYWPTADENQKLDWLWSELRDAESYLKTIRGHELGNFNRVMVSLGKLKNVRVLTKGLGNTRFLLAECGGLIQSIEDGHYDRFWKPDPSMPSQPKPLTGDERQRALKRLLEPPTT